MLLNKNKKHMLQCKDTINISELNGFFTSREKVCDTVLCIICSLKLNSKQFLLLHSERTTYSPGNVLTIPLLFPLFQLENLKEFSQSVLMKLSRGGKDLFYRFKNNELINWRAINFKVTLQFTGMAKIRSTDNATDLRCLIADDTYLRPKAWQLAEHG